jgi:hypothetical protein
VFNIANLTKLDFQLSNQFYYKIIMKQSQTIGIVAALLLIVSCFLPWIEITNLHLTLTGINGKVNDNITFGKPVMLHSFFAVVSVILFYINKIWAKRTNIFICFITLCLAIKNYILFSICRPECPTIKIGLYLLVSLAVVVQLMSLLPKMKLKK